MKKIFLLVSVAFASPIFAQGLVSDLQVQRTVKLTGDITPAQITSNQNDYDPATLNTAAVVRLSSDAARSITGLAGGTDGRQLWLYNVGSFAITLSNESSSSTAANRFAFGADNVLAPKNATLLSYDAVASRWRQAGSSADLSALNANNLTSGTVPDARFPATLPALSGVNLTALNATNLGSGTVPDARFPSVIPATGHVLLSEVSAPSTPASGKVALYAKSDGLVYSKDDAGTETLVSGGAGGGGSGTVTHTGGALTSNAVVLGAGSDDVKVVAGLTSDGTSKITLGVAGTSVGGLKLANATSGTIEFAPTTGALGTSVITFPAATDTAMLLAATQTGTNKTFTSPKIGTAILDTNGNELFNLTATGSAVNEVTFANAATGAFPTFSATGGDTDIGISLTPKGRGTIRIGSIELQSTNSTSGASFFGNSYYDGTNFKYRATDYASAMQMISGGIYYFTAGSGSAGSNVSFTTAAVVTSAGNFLVGTTSETGLTGGGGLRIASTTASSSTTTGAAIVSGGLGVAGDANVGGQVNAATARIGPSGSGSIQPLEIVGTDGGLAITATNTSAGTESYVAAFQKNASSAYQKIGAEAWQWTDNNTTNGYASWNIHTTAYTASVSGDHFGLAVWAKHGAAFFPSDLTSGSAPGDGVLKVNGTLVTTGRFTASYDGGNTQEFPVAIRNTNTGNAAATQLKLGNNASAGSASFISYGSNHSTLPNYAALYNEFNAPLLIGINGASCIRVTATTSSGIRFDNYGAGTLTTDSSGNITATSDARAKDTIRDFKTGLAAVRQLQPKTYHWKKETGLNPDDINVSVYAQDLIKAGVPEAVFTERTEESKDAQGKTVRRKIPAGYYSVSDRAVISVLINAVKDLDAANAALAARVSALEAK